ncbi:MBL fold metallo-hydrolase [Actinomadura montaniterrae]|uniref:MBL fold metallo-hydrolase n=1 Tax=Actinomadura montaniterrae TaxID=1803903 RepID=A0A6L3W552_9ACTN|nr:MBL fold metallo-hydrolase [Actinomadura montaniterrae]KAB2383681.1 MBL fold metallo-hydrolase [Actinomadura montaniterrae]
MSTVTPAVERVALNGLDDRVSIFRVRDEVDAFAIRTDRFVALIDTLSTPELCTAILRELEPDLRGRPLVVVNTHADWDHVWGNAAVGDRAPIIAHAAAGARLNSPQATAVLQEKATAEQRFAGVRLVEPTVTFTDTLTLQGGDLTLHLLHTPGHTDDHIAVWIPELLLCIAGDAAEDPIPEVTSAHADDLRRLCLSLRRLRGLKPSIVLPSHGETTDPLLLERNLGYFSLLADRVRYLRSAQREPFEAPELGFAECVDIARPVTNGARAFYSMCHRKAVSATLEQASLDHDRSQRRA